MIDTLIIGGGAAGLYASSFLPGSTILEGNGDCGRKLLLTGGGRCNYTHYEDVPSLIPHYHGSLPFIRKVLYSHTPDDIIKHFRELGIEPVNENGKIFPRSGDANDIRSALLHARPAIINGKAISISNDDGLFTIMTTTGKLKAKKIILACGGDSYPQTGSDGNGYNLASRLGHCITPPHPALAALSLSPSLQQAEGVTIEITIRKGKMAVTDTAVITRKGISGPAAENFSYVLNGQEDITISFCDADLKMLRETHGAMLLKNALPIPARLSSILLGDIANKKCSNLSKQDERFITENLSCKPFRANAIKASAMSTAGGIRTSEINPATMESRIIPGLYFAGDIIDVNADCGGYSLTWAFATAYIASKTQ